MHQRSKPDSPPDTPASILAKLDLPVATVPPTATLAAVTVARHVVEDFRPLAQSLESKLSAHYWETEGVRPFMEEAVPYTVNNSGWAAENAATVLYANCCETADSADPIRVLELGAGLGLFAKQLLDAFRRLCDHEGCDYYRRLVYHVTDGSAATTRQWADKKIFADHADHVVLAQCDALEPTTLRDGSGQTTRISQLQAVFVNYLLDSLPTAVVRQHHGVAEQLCVRTLLSITQDQLKRQYGLTVQQVAALATSDQPADREKLLAVEPFFEFEVAFRDDGAAGLPHVQKALTFGAGGGRVILNFGAIRCLEACLALMRRGGFMLINDYGPVRHDQVEDLSHTQRFGSSVAAAVHFPFIEHHLSSLGYRVFTPDGDQDRTIHSRLIAVDGAPQTEKTFAIRYSDRHYLNADRVAAVAIEHINAGRLHDALGCYKAAITYCPSDWHLMAQAAEFLTQRLHRYDEAMQLAAAAVEMNPWYSAYGWNTLGNCLFCLGRYDNAHNAYLRAQAIHANNAQTSLNLAHTYAVFGDYGQALASIARGLEHDHDGRFRGHLLQQQEQVLAAISDRRWAQQQRQNQRHTTFDSAR